MIARKFHTFFGLSRLERRLALKTIALVACVRLGLWLLPFRAIQRLSGKLGRIKRDRCGQATTSEIVSAIRLASRYVPRATCLVQAFAAQILLGWHGHAGKVHIGVARDGKLGFRAHAWVESQGRVIIGESDELASYSPMLVLNVHDPH